jgi:hypothetical protein
MGWTVTIRRATMRDSNKIVQAKEQNDQWEYTASNIQVGSVEVEYEIRGNEFEGERLWREIENALRRHEQEFGGDDQEAGDG